MILRVLTYNIRHCLGSDGVQDLTRIRDVLREADVDILFLQEVDRGLSRTGMSAQAAWLSSELGLHFTYEDNYRVGPFKGMGNAILSKYPLHSTWNKHMPSILERRGLIHAEIIVEGVTVDLFATHWGLDAAQRRKQMQFCVDEVNAVKSPAVLCGDLNAPPDAIEVECLLDFASMKDSGVEISTEDYEHGQGYAEARVATCPYTYPVGVPTARIDYVMTRGDWKVNQIKIIDTVASDHYPVYAELEYGSGGDAIASAIDPRSPRVRLDRKSQSR